jgi:hypothetical protein
LAEWRLKIMDNLDPTKNPPPPAAKPKPDVAKVTVLMPAVAAVAADDTQAGTPARGVYLATVAATAIPDGAAIIGEAAGPNSDGNIALIDPATGVLSWVPAADVAQYPDHAVAVAGVHISA